MTNKKEEDAEISPVEDEGRNPPGFKGRPAGDLPKDVPEHVEDVVESKPESKGEGRLGLQVIGDNGKVKEHVEYTRVSGEGSIEVQARNSEVEDGVKWLKTRRDNLPRND